MATCPKCRNTFADEVKFCPTDGEELLADEAFSGADPDLPRGQVVGEYEIEQKIGAGGFGTVYRAVHPLIGKKVAVKVLSREYSSNPQMVSRFIAEARAVNQIRHRNIIDIFSFGVLPDKRQYFVMEYLDGVPFDQYLKGRVRLPPSEAIPVLRQIARALDAAHAAGIAHRDLKPENVFLAFDDDGTPFPKLLDFGIAKLLGDSTHSGHKTRTGIPIGTPYYMSPEQCRGKGVDQRADIYSFGVMVFEVLTGQLPFVADSLMSVMFMHMNDAPPKVSSVCPDLPALLDAPVAHMMAKLPEQRPESASAALEALAQACREAGFDVIVAPVRRPGQFTPGAAAAGQVVTTPGHLTPAEKAAIASAQTLAAPHPSATADVTTVTPAASTSRPTAGSRTGIIVGVVAVVGALGAGGAVYAFRTTSTDPPARQAGATSPPVASPEPLPSTTTAESPSAPPVVVAPADVKLTVQSAPQRVEVYRGDEKIGDAPGPIAIPRGDEKVALVFKAPGYQPKTVEVTPTADGLISVTLTRIANRSGGGGDKKKPGGGEIENPF